MKPSRRLIALLLVWTVLGFIAGLSRLLVLAWWWLGAGLLLLGLIDALLGLRRPTLRLERQLAPIWPVGHWGDVTLLLHHEGGRAARLQLFDGYPTDWELQGLPHSTRVSAGRFMQYRYRVRPLARGAADFQPAHGLLASPLQLWWRSIRLGETQTVRVFPDFSRILGHTLTATDRRLPTAGSLRKRRRGEGTDFRQLREYRQGDSMRAIDWKATARHFKPISREYQEERDQQVVFLLDCGRRMLARDDDTSHFDHALNALLTLAWVAQKQGDAVGLLSFGADVRWLAPQKGRVGLDRLIAGIYDLQASEYAPDHVEAAQLLLSHLKRRAFIVLITNLRDEDDVSMRTAYRLMSGKHLVLCANLRETALDAVQRAPVHSFQDAIRLAATSHYLNQRQDAIRQLGMPVGALVDVTPPQLAAALTDRYLAIKESGAL
ncbi:DUF58 domain-containing protein [Chitinimonas sp.]|uniref:DUF58 domain-containing protein n=1 Tax=Chitinimonas sp. TaxID=1934313 RepID=UPI0035AF99C5